MRLDLFPLNTVLFPGAELPLHIFEPRYLEMIGCCRSSDLPFGVVLIKHGNEVGESATPHEVGTTARITRMETLADGRMIVLAIGERRFRIDALVQKTPHVVGEVTETPFPTKDPRAVAESAFKLRGAFRETMALLLELQAGYGTPPAAPRDPEKLAYLVGAVLDVDDGARQKLLESASVDELLEAERELVADRLHGLQRRVTAKRDAQRN